MDAGMSNVEELKRYIVVHARAQQIPPRQYQEVFGRIATDADGGAGSWVQEWSSGAERLAKEGNLAGAFRYYNLARFPYVNGDARRDALKHCLEAFERYASTRDIHRLDVDMPQGQVRCWTSGLSRSNRRPLLVLMGGIVSIKEQWAPILTRIQRAGMAGLVAEIPGVGENSLRYDADSWQMLSAVIDAVSDRADVAHTFALALSFSGHLALRCAIEDRRIKGIVTSGAPVTEFFTDTAWQRQLPLITVDTLAHLTRTDAAHLPELIRPWALTDAQLEALKIPVAYLSSRRDEIIPPGETARLRIHVADLRLRVNDDVHGSPRHTAESGLWAFSSVQRMRGIRGPQTAAIGALLRLMRAGNWVAGR
jgi:esterase FrsA